MRFISKYATSEGLCRGNISSTFWKLWFYLFFSFSNYIPNEISLFVWYRPPPPFWFDRHFCWYLTCTPFVKGSTTRTYIIQQIRTSIRRFYNFIFKERARRVREERERKRKAEERDKMTREQKLILILYLRRERGEKGRRERERGKPRREIRWPGNRS